jgi:hypothetical protein
MNKNQTIMNGKNELLASELSALESKITGANRPKTYFYRWRGNLSP